MNPMRWSERQAKIEEATFDCIDEIAEELDLKVPYYPEVYWVGRNADFNSLGVLERERDDFEDSRKNRRNRLLAIHKIILIGNEGKFSIAEEAGHFLHCSLSEMSNQGKSLLDTFSIDALEEMWGFFCSKLIDPTRKNCFAKYIDFLPERGWEEGAETLHSILAFERQINPEFLVYQQGYGLGQRLFDYYLSKEISKEDIKSLFLQPLNNPHQSLFKFLQLKYETLK